MISSDAITVSLPAGTDTSALVATFVTIGKTVKVGERVQVSGETANDFRSALTYTVIAEDATTASYVVTATIVPSSPKEFTAFSIDGFAGVITATKIDLPFPADRNPFALVPTFTTTGVRVTADDVEQVSGVTPQNFLHPETYVVTAADGTQHAYVVALTSAPAKDLSSFALTSGEIAYPAVIEGTSLAVTLPAGSEVGALVATFASGGRSVTMNGVPQLSGVTVNDFSAPVAYVVTASDDTTETYTVTAIVAKNSAKEFVSFSLLGRAFPIHDDLQGEVPNGQDVTALAPTFRTTGGTVRVGEMVVTSGVTRLDFTQPVRFVITAEDGTTHAYTVTVRVAALPVSKVVSNEDVGGTPAQLLAANSPTDGPVRRSTSFTTGADQATLQAVSITVHNRAGAGSSVTVALDLYRDDNGPSERPSALPGRRKSGGEVDECKAPRSVVEAWRGLTTRTPSGCPAPSGPRTR